MNNFEKLSLYKQLLKNLKTYSVKNEELCINLQRKMTRNLVGQ